jgi:ABC-2 type transport system permease protein
MSASASTIASPSPFARAGWALADAWTLTRRSLAHWARQPGPLLIGWLFPVMIVLMFGGLFGGAMTLPGGGRYFEFLMPGMFAMTMLFGLESTMMAVATDVRKGITDRFRSLPISASAVVLGRCVADMLNAIVGLAIMAGAGLLLGWRWHNGLAAALAAVALLLLLRFALLWVGITFGLIARSPEWVTAVQILVWPVGFLSSVFVDPATMPGWLGAIAQWNPISITAAASRELFGNPGQEGAAWIARHVIPMAVALPLIVTAIFLPLATYAYRTLWR